MNMKQYRLYRMAIVMVMGAVIGWSVADKNAVLAVVAVVAGTALLYLLRKKVIQLLKTQNEAIEDEMVYKISERASRMTLQIYMMTAAIVGMVLVALREQYPQYAHTGFTLAFSVCAMLIVYLFMYGYYRRHLE